MDQWRSKFSESFALDRHWSIECSSLESPSRTTETKISQKRKFSAGRGGFNSKSTLRSTHWSTPGFPEHPREHPPGHPDFPEHPGALPGALPGISQLAPLCQARAIATLVYFRNEKSAKRGSFRPDVRAEIRPKTSVRPSKSGLENTSMSARTFREDVHEKKLWSESGFGKRGPRNGVASDFYPFSFSFSFPFSFRFLSVFFHFFFPFSFRFFFSFHFQFFKRHRSRDPLCETPTETCLADFPFLSTGGGVVSLVWLRWIQEGFKTLFCRTTKIRFRHLFGTI